MTEPAEKVMAFGDSTDFVPGRVCRIGQSANWEAVRDAGLEKKREDSRIAGQSVQNLTDVDASSSTETSPAVLTPLVLTTIPNAQKRADRKSAELSPASYPDSLRLAPTATIEEKLKSLLAEPALHLDTVKKLAWAGLPNSTRASVWKILLAYEPTILSRRKVTLQRRRREYREAVEQHYSPFYDSVEETNSPEASRVYTRTGSQEDITMRQIAVDLPRTCPGQALFHISEVQLALQRILYVWATRHPASGYVQGMNDLVTPFVFVFMSEYMDEGTVGSILSTTDLDGMKDAEHSLANAEADAYWCLTALLNDIQDYYTFSQPGIQRRVHYLRELVARVDPNLCTHLEDEGLDFLQFAFRWMNCLLMRELPFPLIVRIWDTYLAESDGFAVFHVYVCAALLVSFSDQLQEMDFQDLVMFLQNLPTERWTFKEVDMILSQAYMWRTIFGAASRHLQ